MVLKQKMTPALRWMVLAALCVGALVGCDFQSSRREQEVILARLPSRTEVSGSLEARMTLPNVAVALAQTQLSPLLLFHTPARNLHLFVPTAGLTSAPPHFVAYGANGPKILTNGMTRSITNLQERWILAWFQGARGWEHVDCPIGIHLSHAPKSLALNASGLTLEFDQPAGYWGMMAMYGNRPLPTSVEEAVAQGIPHDEFKKLPRVWEWSAAVPRDPLTRLRYWGSTFAHFPYEAWRWVEPAMGGAPGTFSAHTQFDWFKVPCDFELTPWSQAPISMSAARVTREHPNSVQTSPTCYDMQLSTPAGPLFAVGDSLTYSFRISGADALPASALRALVGADTLTAAVQKAWQPWRFSDGGQTQTPPLSSLRVSDSRMRLEWMAGQGDSARWIPLGEMELGQSPTTQPETQPLNGNSEVQIWR